MNIQHLPIEQIREAPWNPNSQDEGMKSRLRHSIRRFNLVTPLVVRQIEPSMYETVGGAQRLVALREIGSVDAPCVVVEADDQEARLLSQALNRIHGEDDLGLRAELMREVLDKLPQEDVLSLLPETVESLTSLCSLGQEDVAAYLQSWQQAQEARLRHMQFQLTTAQMEVVEEVMAQLMPRARESQDDSPNARGTALFLLCTAYLEREEGSV